jgi:hypothetical protein
VAMRRVRTPERLLMRSNYFAPPSALGATASPFASFAFRAAT